MFSLQIRCNEFLMLTAVIGLADELVYLVATFLTFIVNWLDTDIFEMKDDSERARNYKTEFYL